MALGRPGRVVGPKGGAVVHAVLEGAEGGKTLCGLDPASWIKGENAPEDQLVTCPLCAEILEQMAKAEKAEAKKA